MADLAQIGAILIALGLCYLGLSRAFGYQGQHRLSDTPRHRGYEGREGELHRFTAAYLIERHSSPRWPTFDQDTDRFPAVTP